MKIMVIGATGMLGSQVVSIGQGLRQTMIGLSHKDLDITNEQAVKDKLQLLRPDILINCAGIVKNRSRTPDQYMQVNGFVPRVIEQICTFRRVRMVQVSTDCVFNGDGPHIEDDVPNATDIYGKSKRTGEISDGRNLTIRCSFIGLGSRGLLDWLIAQKGQAKGYKNVHWNGMTAPYAARNIIDFALRDVTGLLHIFGEDMTKCEVLEAANRAFGLGLRIVPVGKPEKDFRLRTGKPYRVFLPPLESQLEEMIDAYRSHTSGAQSSLQEISSGMPR